MLKRTAAHCLFVFISIFAILPCIAQDIKPMQEFTERDRILIIAPHPDDEVIATGGVIQKALKAKAKIKVLFLTNGDHNEPAFIVYEKRLTIRTGEFIHMGLIRREESLGALKRLGLSEKASIFLGYPDFGTMEIFLKYWGDTKPFKDMLTRIPKVPYANSLSPGAPYVGESILRDMEKVISDFKPTQIFVSSPFDSNRDHRSSYLFLQIALWNMEGEAKSPKVFPYLVHLEGWPQPRGYHPDLELSPPDIFKSDEISWQSFKLTDEEIRMKRDALEYYKSENEYNPIYLFTFARKNELVGDPTVIKLSKDGAGRNVGTTLAYTRKDNDIIIRIAIKDRRDRNRGVSIFLIGYRKDLEFSKMPKLDIEIGQDSINIRDKKRRVDSGSVKFTEESNSLILKVPLTLLSNPRYILACAKAGTAIMPFEDTAWRVLELE